LINPDPRFANISFQLWYSRCAWDKAAEFAMNWRIAAMRLVIVALILYASTTAICQAAAAGATSEDKQGQNTPSSSAPFSFSPWTDFGKEAPDAQTDAGKRFSQSHSRFSWPADDEHGKMQIGSMTFLRTPGGLHASPLVALNEGSFSPKISKLWPNLKSEPIPTQWPQAKVEQIPTQWPKLKWLPIAGEPGAQAAMPALQR
jgi:hypothetical protein